MKSIKEKLLLHSCCAPCLSQCLSVLSGESTWEKAVSEHPDFHVTVLFDNPNINPVTEYEKRKREVERLMNHYIQKGMDADLLEDRSAERREAWEEQAVQWKNEPEKGSRCHFCYAFRLEETFRSAEEKGFTAVASTLTLSPLKDTAKINEIGRKLAIDKGVRYIASDFKKNEGYKKSLLISKELGLYRQNYCGCKYSIR